MRKISVIFIAEAEAGDKLIIFLPFYALMIEMCYSLAQEATIFVAKIVYDGTDTHTFGRRLQTHYAEQ